MVVNEIKYVDLLTENLAEVKIPFGSPSSLTFEDRIEDICESTNGESSKFSWVWGYAWGA